MTDSEKAIRQALEAGPTPGPWFVQYGDDDRHMCCTAISTSNERSRNDGQWTQEECDEHVALTLHQHYPFVSADCERDDQNSAYIAACNPAAMTALLSELDALRKHLQFIERWANHHGAKPHMTAQQALSCIQHYPPISAITRSYADGKIPDTPNPWAELDAARADADKLRGFANAIMGRWPDCGDLDGFYLQTLGAKHGLLMGEIKTEPCMEDGCNCAGYGELPVECFKKTPLLTGHREGKTA